jgi:hypothetical protein
MLGEWPSVAAPTLQKLADSLSRIRLVKAETSVMSC